MFWKARREGSSRKRKRGCGLEGAVSRASPARAEKGPSDFAARGSAVREVGAEIPNSWIHQNGGEGMEAPRVDQTPSETATLTPVSAPLGAGRPDLDEPLNLFATRFGQM